MDTRSDRVLLRMSAKRCRHLWVYGRERQELEDTLRMCVLAGCLKRQRKQGTKWVDVKQRKMP